MELVDLVFSNFLLKGVARKDILDLMEQFGLIAKFSSSKIGEKYFVPCQLNVSPDSLCSMVPSRLDPCFLLPSFKARWSVRATTRSGYVISCNVIGPVRNQNIDLTAKGLSSTEMSKQRALWLRERDVSWRKVTACNTKPINRDDFMCLSVRFTNIKMIMIEEGFCKNA